MALFVCSDQLIKLRNEIICYMEVSFVYGSLVWYEARFSMEARFGMEVQICLEKQFCMEVQFCLKEKFGIELSAFLC